MSEGEIEKTLRGHVDLTPMEVGELKRLKKRIMDGEGTPQEKREKLERSAKYLGASLPFSYWNMTWDDFTGKGHQGVKRFVQKYCERIEEALEHGQGLIFSGSHGTGKTAFSIMIAKDAIAKGYTVKYIPVAKVIDLLMESFDDKSFRADLFTVIERVEFLILDDLGKEYLGVKKQLNPMVQLNLDSMLRERMNRNLVTIASTNFEKTIIKNQYGDSVLSILQGACKFVEVTGPDFREVKMKQFWDSFNG